MSSDLPIEAVNAEFTATARRDVVSVEVDGELVIYDDAHKVLHRLNPTASALWTCLDGSGTLAEIAADMADVYGAEPSGVLAGVIEAARQLGSRGLLVGVGDPSQERPEEHPPAAAPPAGRSPGGAGRRPFVDEVPASCMDNSFPLGAAGSMTVGVGGLLLGLRVSTRELAEAAAAVLRPALVTGVAAPPNVSVVETTVRAGRPLYFCYRSGRLVTRARSIRRALEAAVSLLASYPQPAADRARVPAAVAVRDGVAALFGPESLVVARGLRSRLNAAGWELADAVEVDLDPASGDALLGAPTVAFDPGALAGLAGDPSEGAPPLPGRYPVRAWVAVAQQEDQPATAAARLLAVTAGAETLDAESAATTLQAAATMLRGAAWVVSESADAGAIARALAAAVDPRAQVLSSR